jgi:anti-sigma B factor antagonist
MTGPVNTSPERPFVTAASIDPSVRAVVADDLVRIALTGDETSVRLSAAGEIDSSSAPLLRGEIEAVLAGPVQQLVVDLDEVSFLDSAGLSALASAHRFAADRGVRLRVLASSRAVMRPLQITGLWDLLGAEQIAPGTGATA